MLTPEYLSPNTSRDSVPTIVDQTTLLRQHIADALHEELDAVQIGGERIPHSASELDAICREAKVLLIRAEQLVIMVKTAWNEIVAGMSMVDRSPRLDSVLSAFVTATLNSYYREKRLVD